MSSLATASAAVALAAAAAAGVPASARRPGQVRLARVLRQVRPVPPGARAAGSRCTLRLAAAGAGTSVAWLLGFPLGPIAGVVVAVLVDRLVRRLPTAADRDRAAAVAADLPLALNLLGACLRAGSPLGPAVEVVGTALGGPLGAELAAVSVSLRLGSSPEAAWSRLTADPVTRPVGRAVVRVSDSGAALAPLVLRLAEEQRDRARLAAEAAARRAGVLVVAPLGLCFLPAFLLLGVAPVILGLASVVLI